MNVDFGCTRTGTPRRFKGKSWLTGLILPEERQNVNKISIRGLDGFVPKFTKLTNSPALL